MKASWLNKLKKVLKKEEQKTPDTLSISIDDKIKTNDGLK
jgi:hypothetical protein